MKRVNNFTKKTLKKGGGKNNICRQNMSLLTLAKYQFLSSYRK